MYLYWGGGHIIHGYVLYMKYYSKTDSEYDPK